MLITVHFKASLQEKYMGVWVTPEKARIKVKVELLQLCLGTQIQVLAFSQGWDGLTEKGLLNSFWRERDRDQPTPLRVPIILSLPCISVFVLASGRKSNNYFQGNQFLEKSGKLWKVLNFTRTLQKNTHPKAWETKIQILTQLEKIIGWRAQLTFWAIQLHRI